ncbi:hypothetical protein GH714_027961 [Hevea brasiliensis]|uniref:Arf-GAP domain-containing protein n=1 Tax=Hevea brasiliensis TaxID=3981 RepID=A0A6A6N2W5_HEVBR|nr:hypothetical protein GH714_027961 [Hevea brasiliensis]
MAASRRLRDLQSQPGNKICVDCSQKNAQWASVSYGVFMFPECSGKYCGLGVHISFVRSVNRDSGSEIQIKKMEAGGNERLNAFLVQYGIPKEMDIVAKYNTEAASVCRDRIQALTEGRPWRDPPVVEETIVAGKSHRPLAQSAARHLLQLPALPSLPNLPKPALPPMPAIPTLPQPTLPTLPTATLPPLPSLPTVPTVPMVTLPPLPSIPYIPSIQQFPPSLSFTTTWKLVYLCGVELNDSVCLFLVLFIC